MLLDGRVCVITGAASPRGIGRATARMMAEHGAKAVLLDLDVEQARAAAAEIRGDAMGPAGPDPDGGAGAPAVAEVVAAFGRLDVLVNNAGISQALELMQIEARHYEAVTDVSLRGTLYMSQAAVPVMRRQRQGSIVCMSSISAQRGGGIFGGPHYSAAKAGVLGLAKAMARELGPDGIRVNAVTPSLIDTDITGDALDAAMRAKIVESIPLGRIGRTSDVAGVCTFLASDLAAYVTGAVIDVNGGMLIH
jgi:NAD(P)-dependent dehydrogenase (short-subunit alcohol dehydrogenase family)